MSSRDELGFFHPKNEAEVCALVQHARAQGLTLRVRGAGHSVPAAIHADARFRGEPSGAVEVMLDGLTTTTFDDARRRVSVGAGCRFGAEPTGRGPPGPGLCVQLTARGWALPNLGGITHQTVAGFFTTGSAGGSVQHGLSECVVGLRLVDGEGGVHVLTRETTPERLDAVVVSFGLCGVITELTLQCEPTYDVVGEELVFDGALPGFDPFADGPTGFEALLRSEPYARLLWWPQPGVNRFQLWRARRMVPGEAGARDAAGHLAAVPYSPIEPIAGSIETAQRAAAFALGALGSWRAGVGAALTPHVVDSLEWMGAQKLEAALLRAFTPLAPPRPFRDVWHRALPMDDLMSDELLPTSFTELWLPLERTGEVMRRLRTLYAEVPGAAGHFAMELYAGAASSFWLSPGNPGPAVRLNPFWYDGSPGDPRATLFAHLFGLFEDLGYRLHWGKALPLGASGSASQLAAQYPRWNDFLALRQVLDPDGVFLTSYWRAHLGLSEAAPVDAHAVPLRRTGLLPRPPPLRFSFAPADEALLETGAQHFHLEALVHAPPLEVSDYMADISHTHEWMPAFESATFHTAARRGRGAVCDEVMSFMTLRMRVLREEPGRVWVAAIDGCSLPLASRMVEKLTFDLTPEGHTVVRWHIAFDVPGPLAPFFPLVAPLFRALFARGLENLSRRSWRAVTAPARAAAR